MTEELSKSANETKDIPLTQRQLDRIARIRAKLALWAAFQTNPPNTTAPTTTRSKSVHTV
jgi:hypothetical protein